MKKLILFLLLIPAFIQAQDMAFHFLNDLPNAKFVNNLPNGEYANGFKRFYAINGSLYEIVKSDTLKAPKKVKKAKKRLSKKENKTVDKVQQTMKIVPRQSNINIEPDTIISRIQMDADTIISSYTGNQFYVNYMILNFRKMQMPLDLASNDTLSLKKEYFMIDGYRWISPVANKQRINRANRENRENNSVVKERRQDEKEAAKKAAEAAAALNKS